MGAHIQLAKEKKKDEMVGNLPFVFWPCLVLFGGLPLCKFQWVTM